MRTAICQFHRFLSKDKTLEFFLYNLLNDFYKQYPADQFLQLSYANWLPDNTAFTNVSYYLLQAPLYARFWKDRWIKTAAKEKLAREQATGILVFNENVQSGNNEWMFVTDVAPEIIAGIRDANNILCVSQYMYDTLAQKSKNNARIEVLRPWANSSFKALEWDQREQIKEQYSAGKEFICFDAGNATSEQLILILKAFSLFKKWQQTNMLLLLTGLAGQHENATKMLHNYKYNADIRIVAFDDYHINQHNIIAAAWAYLHLPAIDLSGVALMGPMQTETPVITYKIGAVEETIDAGALYCNPADASSIAEAFITLYKNEKTRSGIIRKASAQLTTNQTKGLSQLHGLLNNQPEAL